MAFLGKATYDEVTELAEDVSDIIGMISPYETPLLDRLGDARVPARNVLHEWMEDSLGPGTITVSTAVNSATAATTLHVNGVGLRLQPGDVLRYTGANSLTYEEYVQVTAAVGANSVTVSRGYGSKGPSSTAAGGTLELVANAALEGADAGSDISLTRSRKYNFTQIFQKPIQVSETKIAVNQVGGVENEMAYQTEMRLRELLRDLERAVILGVDGAGSYGSDTAYRTMKGCWEFIATNAASATTLSESFFNNVVAKAQWDVGGNCNLAVADGQWKALIDDMAESRIRQTPETDAYRQIITRYEGTYFQGDILQANRWAKAQSVMLLNTERIQVMPLQGRSFRVTQLAKTGDSVKSQAVGEYTLEFKNEDGAVKAYSAG